MTEFFGYPVSELIVLAGVFLVVVMIILGLYGFISRDPAIRRLTGISTGAAEISEGPSIYYGENQTKLMRLVQPLHDAMRKGEDDKTRGIIRHRLIQAGYYNPNTDKIYSAIRIGLALLLSIGVAPLLIANFQPLAGNLAILAVVSAAVIGYFGPSLALNVIIKNRQTSFKLGMPDALDMILVGIESGMSFPASLQHLCEELADAHPVVCEQFQLVVLEFQAGKRRGEALQSMARRVDADEARTFASMITQSEALGTSLAQTLRVIADEMRTDRLLKAEKTASELPVKMAFPLVLFIFPALFMTIMSPVLIRLAEAFGDAF